MDKLLLEGMEIYGYHGVFPEEKLLGQKFVIDLELFLDLAAAGESDDPIRTVDYAAVFQRVAEIVGMEKYNLIEALAENIATRVLQGYPLLEAVKVRVKKPHAPVCGSFKWVAVEIVRKKQGETRWEI